MIGNYLFNKDKRYRYCILSLISLLVILTVCFSFKSISSFVFGIPSVGIVPPGNIEYVEIGGSVLDEKYPAGISLSLEGTDIRYKVGSEVKTVSADPYCVILPSGKAMSAKAKITLNEIGIYTVRYTANIGSQTIYADDTFSVENSLFSVSDPLSSAYYGTIPQSAFDVIPAELRDTAPYSTLNNISQREGIVIKLVAGDTFNYNRIIDLSDNRVHDKLISFFAFPNKYGFCDAGSFTLKFTDAYDSSNYVIIKISKAEGPHYDTMTFAVASHNGLPTVGYDPWDGLNKDNVFGFGHGSRFSMTWKFIAESPIENYIASLEWDYQNQHIYIRPDIIDTSPIAQLRNYDHFDKLFEGFTDGKAFLSLTAQGNYTETFNLIIFDIDGHNLADSTVSNDINPRLFIDTKGYPEDSLPKAAINKPYRIFDAYADQINDEKLPVNTTVYYNYYSNKTLIPVSNGCFIPRQPGKYTIVYSAADARGNKTVKTLDIVADTDKTLDFSVKGVAEEPVYSGQEVRVASGIDAVNERGNIAVNFEAKHKGSGKIVPVSYGDDGYYFVPTESGEYQITVKASDYIVELTKTFNINVLPGNVPAFFDEVELPKYFIKDASYELPALNGYKFSTGEAVSVRATISVFEKNSLSDAGVDKTSTITNGRYTVGNCNWVTVCYTLRDGDGETVKSYDIRVIDTGYGTLQSNNPDLKLEKYFFNKAGEFTVEKATTHITFKTGPAKAQDGNASLEFINILQARNFSFRFSLLDGQVGIYGVNIYLIDSADESNTLKLSLREINGRTAASVNGGPITLTDIKYYNPGTSIYTLSYSSLSNKIVLNNKEIAIPDSFTGFKRERIRLCIELEEIVADTSFRIISINNQSFTNVKKDEAAPQYIVQRNSGDFAIGSSLYLPAAWAIDVLDPNVTLTLRVVDISNFAPLVSVDGVTMDTSCNPYRDYTITLSKLGTYRVIYSAKDTSRTANNEQYNINVVDTRKVSITLSGGDREGKAGRSVKIAKYTTSEPATVKIYIGLPDGTIQPLKKNQAGEYESSFVAEAAGIYTVYYSALDARNNFVTASYTVTVS